MVSEGLFVIRLNNKSYKNQHYEVLAKLKILGSFFGCFDVLGLKEVGAKWATKKYHRAEKMSY